MDEDVDARGDDDDDDDDAGKCSPGRQVCGTASTSFWT
jgi:hypothetical protein